MLLGSIPGYNTIHMMVAQADCQHSRRHGRLCLSQLAAAALLINPTRAARHPNVQVQTLALHPIPYFAAEQLRQRNTKMRASHRKGNLTA